MSFGIVGGGGVHQKVFEFVLYIHASLNTSIIISCLICRIGTGTKYTKQRKGNNSLFICYHPGDQSGHVSSSMINGS